MNVLIGDKTDPPHQPSARKLDLTSSCSSSLDFDFKQFVTLSLRSPPPMIMFSFPYFYYFAIYCSSQGPKIAYGLDIIKSAIEHNLEGL